MELSWTTFVLEVINFLVLVWILKRFLYRPVLDLIARRRAEIGATLADAESTRAQAEGVRHDYQGRLEDWERERAAAHEALRAETDAERTRLMAELETALKAQREKARVLEERRLGEAARRSEEQAVEHAAEFARRLLSRLAGPALEARLVETFVDELSALSAARQDALRAASSEAGEPISVTSAYAVDDSMRQSLAGAFAKLLGRERVSLQYQEDPDLIGGLRVSIGPWVLRASLKDELSFFTEAAHGAG